MYVLTAWSAHLRFALRKTVHSQLALRVGAGDWKQERNAEKS
jgi:hypothetical protein